MTRLFSSTLAGLHDACETQNLADAVWGSGVHMQNAPLNVGFLASAKLGLGGGSTSGMTVESRFMANTPTVCTEASVKSSHDRAMAPRLELTHQITACAVRKDRAGIMPARRFRGLRRVVPTLRYMLKVKSSQPVSAVFAGTIAGICHDCIANGNLLAVAQMVRFDTHIRSPPTVMPVKNFIHSAIGSPGSHKENMGVQETVYLAAVV